MCCVVVVVCTYVHVGLSVMACHCKIIRVSPELLIFITGQVPPPPPPPPPSLLKVPCVLALAHSYIHGGTCMYNNYEGGCMLLMTREMYTTGDNL